MWSFGCTYRTDCCPPVSRKIVDFKPPLTSNSRLRVRPAAHLVDNEYVRKYSKAIELMKALPDDDPRNFMQQANVHCAYCEGAYDQVGFPNLELQVHNSWLFFPFHRYYLYFFERILGHLIDDPTFGLPFWNWDSPAGMQMLRMYSDTNYSLYNELRNSRHYPPTMVDLDFNGNDVTTTNKIILESCIDKWFQMAKRPVFSSVDHFELAKSHMEVRVRSKTCHMYLFMYGVVMISNQMVKTWEHFTLRREIQFSTLITRTWIGHGVFGRLSETGIEKISTTKIGLLVVSFLRRECEYAKPTPSRKLPSKGGSGIALAAEINEQKLVSSSESFPVVLDKTVRVNVERPKKSRSRKEKEEEEEILVLDVELEIRSRNSMFM
ncbi:Polyphenol oxidase [Hibiscus syriacus]|uniref:Polyphenol oxidase n=1 Tax=Hibiscus syriacus TaxID=106335 RepID=A0A6A3BK31_HIBSY|nr:Polyphenol oxidase [Hibiscus syriacus]